MLHLAAFENSSKIFLRCIFITLDLLISKCLLQPIITTCFVSVKLTFKLLPNTMSVFHSVKNYLSGDLCKSGPWHFASEKSFPQTLPNKLSLVKNKLNHISVWKYVKIKLLELSKVKAAKGPFLTSCDIENFKS